MLLCTVPVSTIMYTQDRNVNAVAVFVAVALSGEPSDASFGGAG